MEETQFWLQRTHGLMAIKTWQPGAAATLQIGDCVRERKTDGKNKLVTNFGKGETHKAQAPVIRVHEIWD